MPTNKVVIIGAGCAGLSAAYNLRMQGGISSFMKPAAWSGALYLAGEYLFLIACTEGALATGKAAAGMAVEDLLQERL
jgi:uncharacterized protein with NAD-binding domain and iron-sulfur cluster